MRGGGGIVNASGPTVRLLARNTILAGNMASTAPDLAGSPAIDAGDNTYAPDLDQRGEGFPRIVNGIIDIGAYEVQKGECDGSAPHGSSGRLNRFNPIGLAVDS